jgi:hypothetical protein
MKLFILKSDGISFPETIQTQLRIFKSYSDFIIQFPPLINRIIPNEDPAKKMIVEQITQPIMDLMRILPQDHVTGFDFTMLQFKSNENIFYGIKINELSMFIDTFSMDNRAILEYLTTQLIERYHHSIEISNHFAETIYGATKLTDIIVELSHLNAASGYKIRFDGQKYALYSLTLVDLSQQMLDAWVQTPFDATPSFDQEIYRHCITQLRMKRKSQRVH